MQSPFLLDGPIRFYRWLVGRSLIDQGRARARGSLNEGGGGWGERLIYLVVRACVRAWGPLFFCTQRDFELGLLKECPKKF